MLHMTNLVWIIVWVVEGMGIKKIPLYLYDEIDQKKTKKMI